MSRILFVNRFFHPDLAPTAQLLADVVAALQGSGHAVHVIASRQSYTDARAGLPSQGEFHGAQVHRVWSTRFGRMGLPGRALDYASFMLAATWRMLRVAGRGDVLVAKTDPPLIAALAALVCRLRGARLVNWIQDLFPDVAVTLGVIRPGSAADRLLSALRDGSLRRASLNVVLGGRMAERIAALGADSSSTRVRHNWVDSDLITPCAPEQNSLRRAWGLEGRFVVGYSGNFGRVHEFGAIMEAARLLKDDAGVAFLFVGQGARLELVKAQARSLGLTNIVFQDYQPRERLRESLGAADAHLVSLLPGMEGCVVPSKFYGIAAAGRPTLFIGAADGEIARLIARHDCGLCCAPDDATALAGHIRVLAADPERCRRLGQNARAATDACYAKPLALAHWREMLLELAGR